MKRKQLCGTDVYRDARPPVASRSLIWPMKKDEVLPMIKAGIIGATGYAGIELVRILIRHPDMELAAVSSVSFEGKPLSEVYPGFPPG